MACEKISVSIDTKIMDKVRTLKKYPAFRNTSHVFEMALRQYIDKIENL